MRSVKNIDNHLYENYLNKNMENSIDNQILKSAIGKAFESLQLQKAEFDKQKCNILIEILQKDNSTKELIRELIQKGLPKSIWLSDVIEDEISNKLSFFSKVYRSPHLKEPTIIFSWFDNYYTNDYQQLPNIFTKFKA